MAKKDKDTEVEPSPSPSPAAEGSLSDFYNNLPKPTPSTAPDLQKLSDPSMPGYEDDNDGKAHRNLNFDSSKAEPGRFSRLRELAGMLGDKISNNLAQADQLQRDNTNIMMDRVKMQNPNAVGPRLPDVGLMGQGMLPQEKAYMDAMASGIAGSVAPVAGAAPKLAAMLGKAAPEVKQVIAKSVPWMKNLTQEAVDAAIPVGEGLVNSTKNDVLTQGAQAAARADALKRLLGR